MSALAYLEYSPDVRASMIAGGHVTLEEILDAELLYDDFIKKMEIEWPPDRLKAWLLDEYRDRCKRCLETDKQLELENKDARAQGVSYKDRQIYSIKIKAIRQLFEDYKSAGVRIKKGSFTVKQFVPPSEIGLIQSRGFETTLRCAII